MPDERIVNAARLLPDYLGQHVALSAAALTLGLLVSFPLILVARNSARVRWAVLAFVSVVQTIPSLALLAFFYPLLLALSALTERVVGQGFSALGFLPSLLALSLYSMLPIIRNGVAALMGLDAAVIEAAKGVGMTDRQRLIHVELPLAAPVLMAGLRTSSVWVIGTATLSTPVGQTSLGNYIFSGLQLEDWISVLFGCSAAVVLAVSTDQLLGLIEAGIARRTRWRIGLGVALIACGVLAATAPLMVAGKAAYVVGAKSFSEQYILGELMARRIREQEATATVRGGLGSVVAFRALAANEIDAYIDYSGTLWANVMGRSDLPPRHVLLKELEQWLSREHGVVLLGALGFENAYALAMKRARAQELGVRSIEDLSRHAHRLRIGGDFEFFARPEWRAIRDAYGLSFRDQRQFQSTFMYQAADSGEVDVISAFSSDGRIAAYDLVLLRDTRQVILPYDAVVLIAPARASDQRFRRALEPLVGAIPIERMQQSSLMVDRDTDKVSPREAAQWLSETLRFE